jgi:hypothetical protein
MREAAVRKKLSEINQTIAVAHVRRVAKAVGDEAAYLPQPADERTGVEELLEVLGLHVQYLLFDLEATRRENRYLRQMLESQPPANGEEDDEADPRS